MSAIPLRRELVINNVVHVQHWRSQSLAIYQNYSLPRATSSQPLLDTTPGILGTNLFHLFRVENVGGAEMLGVEIASYNNLDSAMQAASRTQ